MLILHLKSGRHDSTLGAQVVLVTAADTLIIFLSHTFSYLEDTLGPEGMHWADRVEAAGRTPEVGAAAQEGMLPEAGQDRPPVAGWDSPPVAGWDRPLEVDQDRLLSLISVKDQENRSETHVALHRSCTIYSSLT